ncbi:8243_t:CDS:1 [Funneliformis mosseae]|uniref:8243_t:CDS:1 n=1 Tax=Funneliformis mosseae TaxID=27381 RepID=A0A9N9AYA9_FUNMO|nr:8243_t:CDS:1 [Funneliformis mosseae]
MVEKFPLELLNELFNLIGNDYKTLYSCIFVNKLWYETFVPTLWRNPLQSMHNIKILINCLLVEDNDFVNQKNIKLPSHYLLEKPPLLNYARFVTILNLKMTKSLNQLMRLKYKDETLKDRFVRFIMSHSSIEYLNTSLLKAKSIINDPNFNDCFRNLKELETADDYSSSIFKELTKVCDKIQVFRLHYKNVKNDNGILAKLIEVQNKVKKVYIYLSKTCKFEKLELVDAISSHSKSIVEYHSTGFTEMDLSILRFQNLVTLHLENIKVNEIDLPEQIKSTLFPNLQKFTIKDFHGNSFLNISNFVEINGMGLTYLEIGGNPFDEDNLKILLLSIGRNCKNLESLTTFYDDHMEHAIGEILYNCNYLRKIYLRLIEGVLIYVDDLIHPLSHSKSLISIKFGNYIRISDAALSYLNEIWLGPKPLLLSYSNYKQCFLGESPFSRLKRYEEMGLLKFEITDEEPVNDVFDPYHHLDYFYYEDNQD